MEAVTGFLEGLTVFHWLGIGLILLTLEVAVGTFDLLWIAVAAFITALFALVVPLPLGGWQGQLTIFGFSGIGLVWAGRTLFKGLRRSPTTHPNLNERLAKMVGQKGEAETSFENNRGKVKLGDSVWLAQQADETVIVEGDQVVVSGYDGTILKVKLV
jgi:membrane protein implicated in regulation of membrane protease activity